MNLLRSWLFVPGNHSRRIEKALSLNADAVILDLEDACPVAEKATARSLIIEALSRPRRALAYVRINALSTEFAYGDLLAVIRAGLDGLMLTKVETPDQLRTVDWLVTQLERERGLPVGHIDLVPLVETAAGIAALAAITGASPRVRQIAFGAADLTTDLGITWTRSELELLKFRSDIVTMSRAAGLAPPIDLAWLSIADEEGLKTSIEWGRTLGFQGKLCIHPDHIAKINAAFSPTESQVAKARRVIAAFREAEQRGTAAIQLDGMLVDYAILRQSQRIVELAERIQGESSSARGPSRST